MTRDETGIPAPRRPTRRLQVGSLAVGGGAPISVQSMAKCDPRDVRAATAQIRALARAGCDIVRVAVPDAQAAAALRIIRRASPLPLVADIHFDYRLALAALEAGADGLRINPGTIGSAAGVRDIVRAALDRRVPIRIGVNAGSLEQSVLAAHGGPTARALAASALAQARVLEDLGFQAIKISAKASDAARTVEAYRILSRATDCPLHLGVTEAGTLLAGTVRSAAALGILLAEGIGDTIRVSLTEPPAREVEVALELLRALGLRPPGPRVISCPTCGRIRINVLSLAHRVEAALAALARTVPPGTAWPTVAVMGCMVNGPGEAREADIAAAGGAGKAALYCRGVFQATVNEADIVPALVHMVRERLARGGAGPAPRPATGQPAPPPARARARAPAGSARRPARRRPRAADRRSACPRNSASRPRAR